jgi:hypothetical protein
MTKTDPKEKTDALQAETTENRRLQAVVLNQVLQHLGQPIDGLRVQVRKLWQDHYRVNVFKGAGVNAELIVQSFFLITDDNGAIVAATPRITRQ